MNIITKEKYNFNLLIQSEGINCSQFYFKNYNDVFKFLKELKKEKLISYTYNYYFEKKKVCYKKENIDKIMIFHINFINKKKVE